MFTKTCVKTSLIWLMVAVLVFVSCPFMGVTAMAAENQKNEEFAQSAEISYENGTAVITINTDYFKKFDIAVLPSTDIECTNIAYDMDFSLNVRINSAYTFASVFNKTAIDRAEKNKYAVIIGSGMVQADGSDIPYEGAIASFTYENVPEGTEFIIVSDSANYDDVSEAPVVDRLVAVSQSAEISYKDGTAVVTINTDYFNKCDVAVLTDAKCSNIAYAEDFSYGVRINPEYTFASVFNKEAIDRTEKNKYAVIMGSGMVSKDGSSIPYEGAVATFTYENVEEGAEFVVVTNSANHDNVTKAPVVARLVAVPSPNSVPEIGDVKQDGTIDAADALDVLKVAAKIAELSEELIKAADVTKDGTVDATDALQILKYAARLIDSLD